MLLRHRRVCTWSAKRPTNGSLQVVTNVGYAADKLRNRFVLSVRFDDAILLMYSQGARVSVSRFGVADGCIRASASSQCTHVFGVEPIKLRVFMWDTDGEMYESEREIYCVRAVRHNVILVCMGDAARKTDSDFHSKLAAGQCERKWQ